ncbi:MAG: helix-turn-helix transcriptional regulator [Corynebacterium variabile]|uniref:helix-turn-helix domain-containing protein n=1 Tax=Corynebacterium variabile TaxID=1727 RepID=UPI00264969D2|nr:helix-turn-helix transcriptional regulator [Corynebacterium variabile]MDN6537500.1 helix-turn-helix transcriptional regulator [Corynebacterium variabile]
MAGKKTQEGPTGEAVRANVKRLRESQNLTFAELSRRLDALGNPIPPLGLRRIEQGDRKVDVDDLMALAVALRVAPSILLLPDTDSGDDQVEATGIRGITVQKLWEWILTGDAIPNEDGVTDLNFIINSVPRWSLDGKAIEAKARELRLLEWLSRGPMTRGDDDPR